MYQFYVTVKNNNRSMQKVVTNQNKMQNVTKEMSDRLKLEETQERKLKIKLKKKEFGRKKMLQVRLELTTPALLKYCL